MLPRVQSFEFCELPAAPPSIQSLTPGFLEAVFRVTRSYAVAVPPLAAALRAAGAERIVDLGSGGAGPVLLVQELLKEREGLSLPVVLTDKIPNLAAFAEAAQRRPGEVSYRAEPVDATQVPRELAGFRTMFQLFHHFPEAEARAILQDAVDSGAGIAIFEVTHRSLFCLLQTLFVPVLVLLVTPFIRPLSLARLLLTYVLPIAPLVVLWDALISTLRSYDARELVAMTEGLRQPAGAPRLVFRQGAAWHGLQRIEWLIGVPERRER